MSPAPKTELDDEALARLLHQALLDGAPMREADLYMASVAAENLVNALRRRGVTVLRAEEGD